DDGAALLWVPAGAAPGSADIHVTAIAGGYALTPSGLQFSRPAYLFHRMAVSDGGVLYSASLKSSDGSVEAAHTLNVMVGAMAGAGVPPGAVASVDPSRAALPPDEKTVTDEVARSVTEGLGRLDPRLTAAERASAATAAAKVVKPAAPLPKLQVSWSLECVEK